MMNAAQLFEQELLNRGISFEIDPDSGLHQIIHQGTTFRISLENLGRELQRDGDAGRIHRFVDSIFKPTDPVSSEGLFLMLEPTGYDTPPDIRTPVSDFVDSVLVHLIPPSGDIQWITPAILEDLALGEEEARILALSNLDRELQKVVFEFEEIDEVRLGFLNTSFPSKGSLLLAPGFRAFIEPYLGWPLLAVIPHRDFLYLWNARHRSFIGRVGKQWSTSIRNAAGH
ncbi:MAG: hypothetical protein JWO82_1760 [Akkermansiaceae bacterium]|nr:hypothetical protein [Akkermansiaceae bacterium]